jgi:hypothetical protein
VVNPPGMKTPSTPFVNIALIRGLSGSFAAGDVPAVLGAFDPAIAWNEAESFLQRPRGRRVISSR